MLIFDGFDTGYKNFNISILSNDELDIINKVLKEYPVNNGEALKKLSYETYPMKNLGATI